MVDAVNAHDQAWEDALEEAMNRFEQGEAVTEGQFAELVAELEARHNQAQELPQDDPRVSRLAELRARASRLEASAAEGTGPTDQISSMLAPLTGSDNKHD